MSSADDYFAILNRGENPLPTEDVLAEIFDEAGAAPGIAMGLRNFVPQSAQEDLVTMIAREVTPEMAGAIRFQNPSELSNGVVGKVDIDVSDHPKRATSNQSAFSLSGDRKFENTRGSFSKASAGTSERAYKNFETFLSDISSQRKESMVQKANALAERAVREGDSTLAAGASELIKSLALSDRGSGDSKDILGALKTQMEIGRLQDQREENKKKPVQLALKKLFSLGVNDESIAALEAYSDENPDITPAILFRLALEKGLIPKRSLGGSRAGTVSYGELTGMFSGEQDTEDNG